MGFGIIWNNYFNAFQKSSNFHPPHHFWNKSGEGFTLIELLVVISIIGLISSIVLVSMKGISSKAKITKGLKFSQSINHALGAYAVGVWDFNDQATAGTAYDRSGYGNHGTINGATYVGGASPTVEDPTPYHVLGQGENQYALEFDGINNDLVDIPNTEKFPLFSLSVWAYNKQGGDNRHSMLNHFWEIVGTRVCFWSYDFANTYWRCSNTGSVPYDRWTHIVTVWGGSVISHYINGELDWKDFNVSSGTSQSFRSIAGYSTRKFKGILNEVRIYEQALTIGQIQQRFTESAPRHGIVLNLK